MFRSIFYSEPKLPLYQAKSFFENGLILENLEDGFEGLDGLEIRVFSTSEGVLTDGILTGSIFSDAKGEKKIMTKTGSGFQIEKPIFISDIKAYTYKNNCRTFALFEGFNLALSHLFSIQNEKRQAYNLIGLM